jgi:hypothetical protein
MLQIPRCLDSQLTDGGKVVGLTGPPRFTSGKTFWYFVSSVKQHFITLIAGLAYEPGSVTMQLITVKHF